MSEETCWNSNITCSNVDAFEVEQWEFSRGRDNDSETLKVGRNCPCFNQMGVSIQNHFETKVWPRAGLKQVSIGVDLLISNQKQVGWKSNVTFVF